jgi:hypothetical protein
MKHKAIIVDIDGTISDGSWRILGKDLSTIDWNQENLKSLHDQPFDWCVKLVNLFYKDGYKIIFLTARTGTVECYQVTHQWLSSHLDIPYELFMREEHDQRDDDIIKQDIYYKHIEPSFDILFAIDDKPEVIDMWRNLGITALHCRDYMYG